MQAVSWFSLSLVALLTFGGTASEPSLPTADATQPTCLRSWPEVRYGNLGYDHVVHLASQCRAPATCDVSSDVNPEPIRVIVQPATEQEIVTMRGSPARRFTPRVVCRFPT